MARRIVTGDNGGLLAEEGTTERLSIAAELWKLLMLAGPMFISRVSWVIMVTTDSAVVGHVGARYLDNTALSDLWTASTGVFIQSRVVATFCGQAYGAGNKMLVGIWVQVAIVVLLSMMIPVAITWLLTKPLLLMTGNTLQESSDAGYYALILIICLPVRIFFSQLTSFFSSQKIVRPGAVCATSAMAINLAGALIFVLGIGIPNWTGFGFAACPVVTTVVEYLQFFLLWFIFCHVKQLHTECWPGWSRDHITKDRLTQYFKMYLPNALAGASDWWRVAAVGAVAKSVSADALGVFNVSYRICWIVLTFVGALASAIGVQINIALGQGLASQAKRSVAIGLGLCAVVLAFIGVLMVFIPRHCGQIFSNDEAVLDLFEENRWPLMSFVVTMNLSTCLEIVPAALGRVNAIFYMGLIGSWVGQVPGVLLCTQLWRKDLTGLLTGVSAGYILLCILYAGIIIKLDWNAVVAEARERSEVDKPETSSLAVSMQEATTEELADAPIAGA